MESGRVGGSGYASHDFSALGDELMMNKMACVFDFLFVKLVVEHLMVDMTMNMT